MCGVFETFFFAYREPSQVLVEKPSDQVRLQNRIITPQSESMHLMADLRHMDGYVCMLCVVCIGWRVSKNVSI